MSPARAASIVAALIALTGIGAAAAAGGADAPSAAASRPLERPAMHDVMDPGSVPWCGTRLDTAAPRGFIADTDLPPCASGGCDLPATRDSTPRDPLELRILVHVMRASDGSGGVPGASVDSMVAQINRDFAPHAIQVRNLATLFHDDSRYDTIGTQQQLDALKDAYAQSPSQNLNVFLTASAMPFDGQGTYPWDPDALSARGGLWLNKELVDGVHHSASHEVGHCLGLYHTFHGTDELKSCSDACYEPASGVNADRLGDLCSDTRSTPRNYTCTDPTGSDCMGTPWGATPLHNLMGYGPWWCVNEFTPQQERRMLCWARAALGSMLGSPAAVGPAATGRPDLDVWTGGISEPGGRARVWFAVASPARVTLALFDVRGRRVVTLVDRDEPSGRHELRWDGSDGEGARLAPGVYWLRIAAAGRTAAARLVLVR